MATIRDSANPTRTLAINADGSINTSVSLGEIEVKNDTGNPVPVTGTVQANNLVGGTAVSNGNPLPISDAGGSLTVDGTVSANVAGTVTANQGTAGASPWPVSDGGGSLTVDGTVTANAGTGTFNTALASGPGTAMASPAYFARVPADQAVTAVGAAAAAVTLTIPAAGAGLFHYIDVIEITLYSTAARTGAATPVTATSTNLPGSLAWTFTSAGTIGTLERYGYTGNSPLRSSTANTATTIVCPAVTGGLWRVTVTYRNGV